MMNNLPKYHILSISYDSLPVPDVPLWCYNLHTPILYIRLQYLRTPAGCIRLLISATLSIMCDSLLQPACAVPVVSITLLQCACTVPVLSITLLQTACLSHKSFIESLFCLSVCSQVTVCRKILIWELHSVLPSCNSRWTHLHHISFQMYLNESKIHLLGSCSTIRF